MRGPRCSVSLVFGAALVTYGGCGDVEHHAEPPARVTGCPEPEAIPQAGTDVPSGFVRCVDGLVHRQTAEACLEPYTPGGCRTPLSSGLGDCESDADCDLRPYGACVSFFHGCSCEYGCVTDADCGGGVCVCAGVVGQRAHCASGGCALGADCAGGMCALDYGEDSCHRPEPKLACLHDSAHCRVDAECEAEESGYCPEGDPSYECRFLEEWSCSPAQHCNGPCG